ncbi:MAG: hypothetical protein K8R87_02675, partial [Verrucomicrobia bacterium]|nr:hypothetical protein [Verrucomicrobiota bacterium]
MVAYRDFFDNHTPLFHILMAPIIGWLGERSDIVNLSRLFMIPLCFLALWTVRCLGRSLFSERVGLWAPILAGALPRYFYPSIEFRSDNLWAPLWLVSLAILLTGRPSLMRSFTAGFFAGLAVSISMKTALLLGSLVGAAGLALIFAHGTLANRNLPRLAAHLASGLGGLAILPSMLVIYFTHQGALAQLYQCVFLHNILPADIIVHTRPPSWTWLAVAFLILVVGAHMLFRSWGSNPRSFRRTVLLLHTGFVLATLILVWPVITRQNFLPTLPLVMLLLTAPACALAQWTASQLRLPSAMPVLANFSIILMTITISERPINIDQSLPTKQLIADALRLTKPGEYIMTLKGEAVYRPRPYYYVMETFTEARLNHGLLPDDIADRLITTQTCVAVSNAFGLPPGAHQFLANNYLSVGPLRVAGQKLSKPDPTGKIEFTIKIPADYSLLLEKNDMRKIQLDGKPFPGSGLIGAGTHTLYIQGSSIGAELLWTRAVKLGFK